MIKNLLYSIFLHLLLLTIIYANFNLKNYRQDEVIKVAVNLVAINSSAINAKKNAEKNNSDSLKKAEEKPKEIEDKKPKIKDEQTPKSPKKSNKDKAKKPPIAKNKKAKEDKKPKKPANIVKNNQAKKPEEDKKDLKKELNKEEEKPEKKDTEIKSDDQIENSDKEAKKESKEENLNEEKDEEIAAINDGINSLENINLSAREKYNIQSQLRVCYKRAIKESGKDSLARVTIAIGIDEDGSITANFDDIIDVAKYNSRQDNKYKIAIDNAKRALELCSPLRNLPLDKYDIWKEVLLEFDENMKN